METGTAALVLDEEGQPDTSERYTVQGWGAGIAWRVLSWAEVYDAEDEEWVPDPDADTVWAVMVGDDHKHLIAVDELARLDPLAYCSECGQVGCTHDGRER